jgi:hypothetical protein
MKCSRYGSAASSVARASASSRWTQEAEDQRTRDAELAAAALAGGGEPADDDADVDAAGGVRLRVEEDLRMEDVVGGGALQVGERHVGEVALVEQHAGTGVVDVEEALQVGKGIRGRSASTSG